MTNKKPAKPPKEHDRFRTFNHMVDCGFAKFGMTATERAVWQTLFRHADKRGHCHVSYSRLASGSGLSPRRCKSKIKSLIAKGVVKIVCSGNREGESNHYCIYGKTKKHEHQPETPET